MASFEEEADQLHKAGWQQCSTFHPNDMIGGDLGLPEGAVLIVLTQACSVVSYPLKRDPLVELIVAIRQPGKFNPRDQQATGANARKLLIELDENGTPVPYLLDIYQRHFAPREKLLGFSPDGPRCSEDDTVRVANWVARYYTRTALPTKMVVLLKEAGFQGKIEAVLKSEFEGAPLHEQVAVIYGRWEPNDETGPYHFSLNIAVRSVWAMEHMQHALGDAFGVHRHELEIESIKDVLVQIEVVDIEAVSLKDYEEQRRISEWDLLSGLMEEA